MFRDIQLKELKLELDKLDLIESSYIKSYPFFINYFENIETIKLEHLIIASHFVYGWMPTIIDLSFKNTEAVLKVLNKAKQGELLNEGELLIGKKAINNSLVGLSKLLHFINPSVYAIWDSRIFRFLTHKKSSYGISEPINYLKYLNYLGVLVLDSRFKNIHKNVNQIVGYEVSSLRAIELIMFEADKNRS